MVVWRAKVLLYLCGSGEVTPKFLNYIPIQILIKGLGPSPVRWLAQREPAGISQLVRSHLAREASTAVCAVVESAYDRGA